MSAVTPLGQRLPLCRKLKQTGPAIDRWDLLDLVKTNRIELGIGEREIAVLCAHLTVMPKGPLIPGALNISYMEVDKILVRANCMGDRRFRRGEVTLANAGLVVRKLSPNKRRFPLRVGGKIVDAYGIDINPLLDRVADLKMMRNARLLREEQLNLLRTKISSHIRDIRQNYNSSISQMVETFEAFAVEVRKISRRKSTGIEEMIALLDRVIAFEANLISPPHPSRSVDGNACKSADLSDRNAADAGQSVRHNESNLKESIKDIPKPSVDRDTIKEYLGSKTCGRRKPERHTEFNLGRVKALWSSASNLSEMYPEAPRNERQLYNLLHEYSSYFRLGQETIARSLAILGWERLLVAMDYLAEKIQGIQNPRAYLQSMLKAFESGQRIAGGRVSPAGLSARLNAV